MWLVGMLGLGLPDEFACLRRAEVGGGEGSSKAVVGLRMMTEMEI